MNDELIVAINKLTEAINKQNTILDARLFALTDLLESKLHEIQCELEEIGKEINQMS